MGEHHDAELATAALQMAVAIRGGDVGGVIFHTDKGSEYTASPFKGICARLGIAQSMGRVGPGQQRRPRASTRPWSGSC